MNGVAVLCNRALGMAGCAKVISDINEVSAEAKLCKRFYDSCRQKLLCMSQWNFATGITELALTAHKHPRFKFVYMYPNSVLRINRVFSSDYEENLQRLFLERGGRCEGSEYAIEHINSERFVCTDAGMAFASVIYDIEETSEFPPLFNSALTLLLASDLAVPLSGGNLSTKQALYQQFMNEYYAAATMHANEARELPYKEFEDYCEARR